MINFNFQKFDNEEDLLQRASTDVTQLCAENVIMWNQFLDTITLNSFVLYHLATEHHNQRVCNFVTSNIIHSFYSK